MIFTFFPRLRRCKFCSTPLVSQSFITTSEGYFCDGACLHLYGNKMKELEKLQRHVVTPDSRKKIGEQTRNGASG